MRTQQATHQSQVVLRLPAQERGENREAPLTPLPVPAARPRGKAPSPVPGTGAVSPSPVPKKPPSKLTKWCMSPLPLCEVITRRSGLRLLAASWAPCEGGGGGGDLAGMILPKVLPLETGRRPGEARALT